MVDVRQEPPAEAGGVSALRPKIWAVLERAQNSLAYSELEARRVRQRILTLQHY